MKVMLLHIVAKNPGGRRNTLAVEPLAEVFFNIPKPEEMPKTTFEAMGVVTTERIDEQNGLRTKSR